MSFPFLPSLLDKLLEGAARLELEKEDDNDALVRVKFVLLPGDLAEDMLRVLGVFSDLMKLLLELPLHWTSDQHSQ